MSMSMSASLEDIGNVNVNRKLAVYKHRKKSAANDAQLLMNRIALLQKEEERARKKIEHTRERADEILYMRADNAGKMKQFSTHANDEKSKQDEIQRKNKLQDEDNKKNIQIQSQILLESRKGLVMEMRGERKKALKAIVKDQQNEVKRKQKKRDEIRRAEEAIRKKKEADKAAHDKKVREEYEAKALAEAAEARRAEKLVKALEKKEREWIDRLKLAQKTQEDAFEYLEGTLTGYDELPDEGSSSVKSAPSKSSGKKKSPTKHK